MHTHTNNFDEWKSKEFPAKLCENDLITGCIILIDTDWHHTYNTVYHIYILFHGSFQHENSLLKIRISIIKKRRSWNRVMFIVYHGNPFTGKIMYLYEDIPCYRAEAKQRCNSRLN